MAEVAREPQPGSAAFVGARPVLGSHDDAAARHFPRVLQVRP